MGAEHSKGILVIIGGAEDKEGDRQILREFVRCAGGVKARIVVLPLAARYPQVTGAEYVEIFRQLGATANSLQINDRQDAESSETLAAIAEATGVFFTGGNQSRIVALLQGTELDRAIHHRYNQGMGQPPIRCKLMIGRMQNLVRL